MQGWKKPHEPNLNLRPALLRAIQLLHSQRMKTEEGQQINNKCECVQTWGGDGGPTQTFVI